MSTRQNTDVQAARHPARKLDAKDGGGGSGGAGGMHGRLSHGTRLRATIRDGKTDAHQRMISRDRARP
jgi:hypothetical protein